MKTPGTSRPVMDLELSVEGKLEVLHYLNFVLTDEQEIATAHKSIPYHQRASLLKQSFQKQLPALEEIYGNAGSKTMS